MLSPNLGETGYGGMGSGTGFSRTLRQASLGAAAACCLALAALGLGACGLFGPGSDTAVEPVEVEPAEPDIERLKLLDSQHIDNRLLVVTLQTSALAEPTRVQILLPDLYDTAPTRRFPVVYLLQGAIDDYTAWVREGHAEAITAGYPMIFVMPDAGNDGFYSDWFNGGAFGPPRWESYHIDQLVPWIDAHYRTLASRRGRAIAGVSMGGFGAASYAARHPDLFAAVVSFSGLVNSNTLPDQKTIPEKVFGPRASQEVRWRGHNPWDLAGNLRGMDVSLYTRNGLPGKDWLGLDPAEIIVHQQNVDLHQQLLAENVPHHWDDHGAGPHKWPTWQEDLTEVLVHLAEVFAAPPPDPSPVSFKAIEPDYRIYGWHVVLERPVLEFSALRDADAHGFSLSGSGSAIVTTPPVYTPHTEYALTMDLGAGPQTSHLRSTASGRLAIHVPLGPVNPYQQYTEAAKSAGGNKEYVAKVTIRPVPGSAAKEAPAGSR